MATLISSPATVSVTSFPYSLPNSPGEVVFIGTNFPQDVRPSSFSVYDWDYGCFGYYGGGVFLEDYSQGGAWAVAGSGGHDSPPIVGACIFDFQDATWKRKDNTNNVPWRPNDYQINEVVVAKGIGEGELLPSTGATGNIPCPGHLYATMKTVRTANGGSPVGSILHLLTHYQTKGDQAPLTHSYQSHVFNVQTGRWSRISTNVVQEQWGTEYFSSAYDPVGNRYYMIRRFQGGSTLDYLDGNDWTWKKHSILFPFPGGGGGYSQSCFIDLSRRMLVVGVDGFLVGLNLANVNAGWSVLSTSGPLPDTQSQFTFYPPDGRWYARHDNQGSQIFRLQPPPANANPFAGTWTGSIVTLGASLPSPHIDFLNGGSRAHNRFFYVPSIQRLAWIAGTGQRVALVKPS